MNTRILTILFIFLGVFACSSNTPKKVNPETAQILDKYKEAIELLNNKVVAPLMHHTANICLQREIDGSWGAAKELNLNNPVFEKSTILNDDPEYSASYKMKAAKVSTQIQLDYSDIEGTKACTGFISFLSAENMEILKFPVNIKTTKLQYTLDQPYESYQNSTKPLAFMLSLALAAKAQPEKQKTPDTRDESLSFLSKMAIATSICILLDTSPNQCPINFSQNTNKNDSDRKERIQEKLKSMMKDMKTNEN